MQVPGRAGLSLLGDESIEFYKTPREYMEKRRKSHGDVFLGRIINKRTVFLTSNRSVQSLLQGKYRTFKNSVGTIYKNALSVICILHKHPVSPRIVVLLFIDEWQNFSMGYKEFMYELFDQNVLFLEGKYCLYSTIISTMYNTFLQEMHGRVCDILLRICLTMIL